MTHTFTVGDKVKATAYTDCFGKEHAEVTGLVVMSVRHMPASNGVEAYTRLNCYNQDQKALIVQVEASARFFVSNEEL